MHYYRFMFNHMKQDSQLRLGPEYFSIFVSSMLFDVYFGIRLWPVAAG